MNQNIKNVVSEVTRTLSYLVGVACIVSLFFLTGCAASTSGEAKSAADWEAAWKYGECQSTARPVDYTACLEKLLENTDGKILEEAKERLSPPTPAKTSSESSQTTIRGEYTEETTVVMPPQAPPPSLMPSMDEGPKKLQFPSGGFIFVPKAMGVRCDLPSNMKPLQFKIGNGTKYNFEVWAKMEPLNCEVGDKFTEAKVIRGGKPERTWVLRATRTGRLVALPFEGGIGDEVEVLIKAYLDLGDNAPGIYVGSVRKTFKIPASDGGSWVWDITPSMIR